MNKLIAIFLSLGFLLCISCKKEEEPMPQTIQDNITYCFDYPLPSSNQEYNLFYDGTQYLYPQVNFQNDKMVFYRFNTEDYKNQVFEIVEYDIHSETERIVAKDYNVYPHLASNKFGDVFFNSVPKGLNIIIDGIVTKIPHSKLISFPVWLSNRRYGFQKGNRFYISDIKHNLLDSIDLPNYVFIADADINKNNEMVFESQTDGSLFVFTLNLNTKALTTLQKYNSDNKKSIRWHPDSKSIYYTNSKGLIKYDLQKKQEEVIQENCDNKVFESFSFSSDNTLFVQCKNMILRDSSNIDIKEAIYKMDADGKNIERVF